MHAPAPLQTALVGRDGERTALRQRLAAALEGRGSLVLVGGGAGIGKTALVEEFGRTAADLGVCVRIGHCYDLNGTPPYGPWSAIIRRLPRAIGSLAAPALTDAGGAGSQAALFGQVRDFLAAIAHRSPLLLILEDLHWADPATLDLLRFISRDLADLPLLIVATYRAEEIDTQHPFSAALPALVRETDPLRLALRPLSDDDVRALIAARYPLTGADRCRLVRWLQERAEGFPFFILELLRTLEEERVLRTEQGRWKVGDLTRVRLPPLLRQIIAGRLARMDEEARRLLAIAAVIGDEVPLALWRTVSGTDEERLLDAVQRAVGAHLLEEIDGTRVRFAHALVRRALYEGLVPSLLPSRRAGWHRRIGEALAASPAPDPDPVAYHFRQAGDARAAEWLVRAGERAHRAHAYETAAERFAAALDAAVEAGPSERGWLLFRHARMLLFIDRLGAIANLDAALALAAETGDAALAAYARADRGWLRCASGDIAGGLADLETGVAALDALPPIDHADHPALHFVDPQHRRGTLVYFLALVGRCAEACTAAGPFSNRAAMRGMPGMGGSGDADAAYGEALARATLGEPRAARRAFARAREAYRSIGHHWMARQTAEQEIMWVILRYETDRLSQRERLVAEAAEALRRAGAAQPHLGTPRGQSWLLLVEGRWDEAHEAAEMERGFFPTVANTYHGMVSATTLGLLAYERGDTARAWEYVREALPAGPEDEPGAGRLLLTQALQRLSAFLAESEGDLDTARAWLEAHDRWLDWSGATLGRADGHLGWAAYHHVAGDDGRARRCAEQARALAEQPRQPLALLAAERLLGELDTAAGRASEAAAHLDAALRLADACAAPFERALTMLAQAELRAATGDAAGARTALDDARAICTPLGATRALARADALAARLAASPAHPPAYPDGLTAREVDVLRQIAAGRSNREIADALCISVRTVNRHITNLYGKIGARNKADATAYALRHPL